MGYGYLLINTCILTIIILWLESFNNSFTFVA